MAPRPVNGAAPRLKYRDRTAIETGILASVSVLSLERVWSESRHQASGPGLDVEANISVDIPEINTDLFKRVMAIRCVSR